MITGIAAFDSEWQDCQASMMRHCLEILGEVRMSQHGLRYVADLKGYPRIPYLSVIWVPVRTTRVDLGTAVCMHAIGIKLLDDLLDGDQDLDRWDQILGVYLIQVTSAVFSGYPHASEAMRRFENDYRTIWRMQLEEARAPARSLDEWVRYARIKSGLMMACYADVACLAGTVKHCVPSARDFAEAIGVLFMIGDDIRDHAESGETRGNLVELIRQGQIDRKGAIVTITAWCSQALCAIRRNPPVYDLSSFVSSFSNKLIDLLPHAT
jgi:hypothetical protein